MNRSVDATVRLPRAQGGDEEEREQESAASAFRRRGAEVRVSRENVSPIDRNEPDSPGSREATRPDPDPELPDASQATAKWRREVRDAAASWSRLTEDDLADIEARRVTLTDLIQERYALSRAEVDGQITGFIEDHQAFAL